MAECSVISNVVSVVINCLAMPTFNDESGLGTIEVDITSITDKVGPYHYIISDEPITDLIDVYNFLKDTIYGDTLPIDSLTFFKGTIVETAYTTRDLTIGEYYVKVFDSRGVLLLTKQVKILPNTTLLEGSNVIFNEGTITTTENVSHGSFDYYISDWSKRSIEYELSNVTTDQYYGFTSHLIPSNDVTSLEYGFVVSNGNVNFKIGGVEQASNYPVPVNSKLKLIQNENKLDYYINGLLVNSDVMPSEYMLKSVVGMNLKGLLTKYSPKEFYKLSPVKSTPAHCLDADGTISVNPIIKQRVGPYSTSPLITVTVTNDEVGTIAVRDVGGTYSSYTYSNLIPGFYTVIVTVGITSTTYHIEVLSRLLWTNLNKVIYSVGNESILGSPLPVVINFSPSGMGSAESNNEMEQLNMVYYVEFKIEDFASVFFNGSNLSYVNSNNVPGTNSFFFLKTGTVLNTVRKLYVTGPGGFLIDYYVNSVCRLEYNPSTGAARVRLKSNNVLNPSYTTVGNPLNLGTGLIKFKFQTIANNIGISNVVTNMPCKFPKIYAKLERTVKGVNYKPNKNKFYFYYDEEYTGTTILEYKVFNASNAVDLSSTDIPNLLTKEAGTSLGNEYGDNRYNINVTTLNSGSYILEVKNEKNEKFYLRFTKP